jgi:hypothetical protein
MTEKGVRGRFLRMEPGNRRVLVGSLGVMERLEQGFGQQAANVNMIGPLLACNPQCGDSLVKLALLTERIGQVDVRLPAVGP